MHDINSCGVLFNLGYMVHRMLNLLDSRVILHMYTDQSHPSIVTNSTIATITLIGCLKGVMVFIYLKGLHIA